MLDLPVLFFFKGYLLFFIYLKIPEHNGGLFFHDFVFVAVAFMRQDRFDKSNRYNFLPKAIFFFSSISKSQSAVGQAYASPTYISLYLSKNPRTQWGLVS